MLNWFKSLMSESGDVSMTRFLSLLCVVTACLIAITASALNTVNESITFLCGTFLSIGLGAKVGQKFIEQKSEAVISEPETGKSNETL